MNEYLNLIISCIPIVSILYITSKKVGTYKLNKEYMPKDITKVVLPPELIEESKEISKKNTS